MLVLRRKAGESVLIGEDVVVKVLQAGPNDVKLGFDCPPNVKVLRTELKPEFKLKGKSK